VQRGSWHIVQRGAISAACQLNAPALVCFAFRLCRPSAQELRLQCLLAMRTCTYPHRHTHMHTNAHRRPLCRCHPGPTPTHTLAHPSRENISRAPGRLLRAALGSSLLKNTSVGLVPFLGRIVGSPIMSAAVLVTASGVAHSAGPLALLPFCTSW
jgi:hypothetical protein